MKRLSLLLLLSGITLACCVRYLHPDGDDAGELLFSVLRNASAYSAAFAAGVVATLCLGQVGALRELFGKLSASRSSTHLCCEWLKRSELRPSRARRYPRASCPRG